MRFASMQPLHTGPASFSGSSRHLLATPSSAQTTYIALIVIGVALVLLTGTCCIMQRCLCRACARKGAASAETGEKDVDLTSVLTSSQMVRNSVSSIHSSPGRMARADAHETAAGGGAARAGLPPMPASLSYDAWGAANRPQAAQPLARGMPRKPATSMEMMASYRASAAATAATTAARPGARRPGGLPTIPSVTTMSMGSITRSEFSDNLAGGQSHLALMTDPSMTSQTGAANVEFGGADASDASDTNINSRTATPQGTPRRVREALGHLESGTESQQNSPDTEIVPGQPSVAALMSRDRMLTSQE